MSSLLKRDSISAADIQVGDLYLKNEAGHITVNGEAVPVPELWAEVKEVTVLTDGASTIGLRFGRSKRWDVQWFRPGHVLDVLRKH